LADYDGINFDPFSGEALFVAPTMYASLSKDIAISTAWSIQVGGRAIDAPGSLDLGKKIRSTNRHAVTIASVQEKCPFSTTT
jgi:hypothetical protein